MGKRIVALICVGTMVVVDTLLIVLFPIGDKPGLVWQNFICFIGLAAGALAALGYIELAWRRNWPL